ncbi:MAG: HupE/UreJ family protein [Myxococcota bacterium]
MVVALWMLTFVASARAHPPTDPCIFDPLACKAKGPWNFLQKLQEQSPGLPEQLKELPKELPTPPPARPDASEPPPAVEDADGGRRLKRPTEASTKQKRRQAKPPRRRTKDTTGAATKKPTTAASRTPMPEPDAVPAVPATVSDVRPAVGAEPAPPEPSPLDEPPPEQPTTNPPAETSEASAAPLERSTFATAILYMRLGYTHILPLGLDHILFVLGLFLASTRVRPLLLQITAFTVAHTSTLALAIAGLVEAPADIIEPLIALSIVFVAVENIYFEEMTRWRPFVVFLFGLFHGLGFASVLTELGLPSGHFATALISFNVGFEAGQLSVVAMAAVPAVLLYRRLKEEKVERLYRPIAVVPLSLVIAAIGLYWTFERTVGG